MELEEGRAGVVECFLERVVLRTCCSVGVISGRALFPSAMLTSGDSRGVPRHFIEGRRIKPRHQQQQEAVPCMC